MSYFFDTNLSKKQQIILLLLIIFCSYCIEQFSLKVVDNLKFVIALDESTIKTGIKTKKEFIQIFLIKKRQKITKETIKTNFVGIIGYNTKSTHLFINNLSGLEFGKSLIKNKRILF